MKSKLILSMDGLVLREVTPGKERMTIGRKPQNDIQIDNPAISGTHAVIVTLREDSFLEDLNSTNGTFVNGQPITKHFLEHGDVIEMGKYKLKYLREDAPPPMDGNVEGSKPRIKQGVIKVVSGKNAGRELLLVKEVTTLGTPGVQVVTITRTGNDYSIAFVEGKTFPRVNNGTLDAKSRKLKHADRIDLDGAQLEFQLR